MSEVGWLLRERGKDKKGKANHQLNSMAGRTTSEKIISLVLNNQCVNRFTLHLKGVKITIFFLSAIVQSTFILIQNRKRTGIENEQMIIR